MGATGLQRPQAQALLGRFLFSGWDAHEKPVVALSGGERRRLALALVVASGANFLVLDEPTNHLDLESRESLEAALEAFPGTVLLVSHDRAVLDAVAERIVAVEDGTLRSYPGGWADYVRIRAGEERAGAARAAEESGRRRRSPRRAGEAAAAERARADRGVDRGSARPSSPSSSGKLAEDWGDADTLAAHRARARRPAAACSRAGSSSSTRRRPAGVTSPPSGGVDTVCRR